jgi:hypothetical protein
MHTSWHAHCNISSMTKLEATLNALMMILIMAVFSSFQPMRTADALESVKALQGQKSAYEMDEYETCTIVKKLPDSICDRLLEQ